jgi:hypothetical protein
MIGVHRCTCIHEINSWCDNNFFSTGKMISLWQRIYGEIFKDEYGQYNVTIKYMKPKDESNTSNNYLPKLK